MLPFVRFERSKFSILIEYRRNKNARKPSPRFLLKKVRFEKQLLFFMSYGASKIRRLEVRNLFFKRIDIEPPLPPPPQEKFEQKTK